MAEDPRPDQAPGDEAPPDEPSSGENVCPDCGGDGCESCGGTGRVNEAVGGG
jgi:hypothetical protein